MKILTNKRYNEIHERAKQLAEEEFSDELLQALVSVYTQDYRRSHDYGMIHTKDDACNAVGSIIMGVMRSMDYDETIAKMVTPSQRQIVKSAVAAVMDDLLEDTKRAIANDLSEAKKEFDEYITTDSTIKRVADELRQYQV